jgi:hypothetical protein
MPTFWSTLKKFKSFKPFKYHAETRYTRDSIVTISLFYQLENFSRRFARLQTKLNVHSHLYHCEFSQRSARYKILNTTEHERQDRSD